MNGRKWAYFIPQINPEFYLLWYFLAAITGVIAADMLSYRLAAAWIFWIMLGVSCAGLVLFLPQLQRWALHLLLMICFFISGITAAAIEMRMADYRHAFTESMRGTFTLQIERAEYTASDRLRLTGRIEDDTATDAVFRDIRKVRISMPAPEIRPQAGDMLSVEGRLFPLSPPAFSNAPDYARGLWFRGIDATGIAWRLHHAEPRAPPDFSAKIERYRQELATKIRQALPAPHGAVATTMLVGVRDGLGRELYEEFRKAGLSHLLAISGLHMGIFCFLILALCKKLFALFPSYAMRYPVHKAAALIALCAGFGYLLLTGMPVSALRAFCMAAIFILAILTDRIAFTQRNLALVGLVILLISPSVIFSASFQLSFAATAALLYGYQLTDGRIGEVPVLRHILFLSFSSALITFATMPFVIWHFAAFSPWGVLSNIIAIPLTALCIMPAGVLILIAAMADMAGWVSPAIEIGITILLYITSFFADLPYSSIRMNIPPLWILYAWSICVVGVVSISAHTRIIPVSLLAFIILCWMSVTPPVASLHIQSQRPILVWSGGGETLFTSGWVSEYWQRQTGRFIGSERQAAMMCNKGVCRFSAQNRDIGFVDRRYGLTTACTIKLDVLVTLHQPQYPCLAPEQILHLPTGDGQGYLITPDGEGYAVSGNLDGLVWRPWRDHLFKDGSLMP